MCCLLSLLGCQFAERVVSYGDLRQTDGQLTTAERLMFRELRLGREL